ncbi:MAG: hypothetical protein ACXWQE_12770 [Bdellovibrionales bacterium]
MLSLQIVRIGRVLAIFCLTGLGLAATADTIPSDFRDRVANAILQKNGVTNLHAEVSMINPVSGPAESMGAVLYPIEKGLEQIGVIETPNYVRWIPRVVAYYANKGNAWVASCYLDMFESKVRPGKFFLRSRQCNLTSISSEAIPNGDLVAGVIMATVETDASYNIQKIENVTNPSLAYSNQNLEKLLGE